MTVIKINAITVPADSGDELARRFAARAGAVDGQPGFEGFELLRPTDDRHVWLVLTRWADEDSFQTWVRSRSFADGHRERPADASGMASAPPADPSDAGGRRPVGVAAELWSYEVAGGSHRPFEVGGDKNSR
jgi:heme-degrading monooxygenase HmoA